MKALQELFEGQWGKLVESLVEGDLVNLLPRFPPIGAGLPRTCRREIQRYQGAPR